MSDEVQSVTQQPVTICHYYFRLFTIHYLTIYQYCTVRY